MDIAQKKVVILTKNKQTKTTHKIIFQDNNINQRYVYACVFLWRRFLELIMNVWFQDYELQHFLS